MQHAHFEMRFRYRSCEIFGVAKTSVCLQQLSESGTLSQYLVELLGVTSSEGSCSYNEVTLNVWLKRYEEGGVEGLKLLSGRGRKPILEEERKCE